MSKAEAAAKTGKSAVDGLEELAFAPVNDAVRLLVEINQLDAKTLSRLNLSTVSEIKQNKDGYLEIKFYNRLKALELLAALNGEQKESDKTGSFLKALEEAAKSACEADEI